jgi:hypothetical protein
MAGFVTLGIEWLAKPRLEARKERILARCRRDAEIRRQLVRIFECGIRLSDYPQLTGATVEQRKKVREIYKMFVDRAHDAIGALDDAISDMTFDLSTEQYSLFSGYIGFIVATLASGHSQKRKGQLLSTATIVVRSAYEVPRWRRFRKSKRIALAEHVIRNPPAEDEIGETPAATSTAILTEASSPTAL